MCEQTPAVVYCVGYVLPVSCCIAGACTSCYGCYRYYRAGERRRMHLRRIQMEIAQYPDNQPRLKRDTLKKKMTKAFSKSTSDKTDKDVLGSDITAVMLKDMRDACPICIDTYDSDPKNVFIGLVKNCGHYFHFECLWNWLELNQTCPICRERCDLSETDLQGLSLEQVLKHAIVSEAELDLSLTNEKAGAADMQMASSETRSIGQRSSTSSVTSRNSTNSRHNDSIATVVTTQPKSVRTISQKSRRGDSFVDRMRAKFENGGDNSEEQVTGSMDDIRDTNDEALGTSNPAYE